jgi:hypothetical protein
MGKKQPLSSMPSHFVRPADFEGQVGMRRSTFFVNGEPIFFSFSSLRLLPLPAFFAVSFLSALEFFGWGFGGGGEFTHTLDVNTYFKELILIAVSPRKR